MKYSDFFTEKGIPRKVYALEAPEIGGILIEIGFSGPIVCPKRKICLLAHETIFLKQGEDGFVERQIGIEGAVSTASNVYQGEIAWSLLSEASKVFSLMLYAEMFLHKQKEKGFPVEVSFKEIIDLAMKNGAFRNPEQNIHLESLDYGLQC